MFFFCIDAQIWRFGLYITNNIYIAFMVWSGNLTNKMTSNSSFAGELLTMLHKANNCVSEYSEHRFYFLKKNTSK